MTTNEAQRKLEAIKAELLRICDGSNWPEYAQTGDGYRAYTEITYQLHEIVSGIE